MHFLRLKAIYRPSFEQVAPPLNEIDNLADEFVTLKADKIFF